MDKFTEVTKDNVDSAKKTLYTYVAIALLIGFIGGCAVGAFLAFSSKVSRTLDDAHEVKVDFDKAKVVVGGDYKKASKAVSAVGKEGTEKAKESVRNVDAKELGDATTKGTKEVGSAFKRALIKRIKDLEGKEDCGCHSCPPDKKD